MGSEKVSASELPSSWGVSRLESLAEIAYGKGLPKAKRESSGLVPVYGSGGQVGTHIESITLGPTIVIGRKGSIGATYYSTEACWPIDTTYYIDSFSDYIDTKYLYYYLSSRDYSLLDRSAAIPGIRREDLYEFSVPLPYPDQPSRSLLEQRRIVARIEALLGEVREMRKLQEEIAADASRLIDTVLAETFRIAEGRPQVWEWRKIGDVCKTTSGGTPSRKRPDFFEGSIPWVKSGELPDGYVSMVDEYITEEAVQNSSAKVFPKGTLLMAMYGATVGKLGILDMDAATNQAVCAIFTPDYVERDFLFWYLRGIRSELVEISFGGAQPNISQTVIKNISFPIPYPNEPLRSVAEQRRIANYLGTVADEIRELDAINRVDEDYLAELEQAILAQAFRGKL